MTPSLPPSIIVVMFVIVLHCLKFGNVYNVHMKMLEMGTSVMIKLFNRHKSP